MTVGVIVLAAGRATRMLGASKLTAELHGKPVVAHVVDAAAAAGLPSPLVVIGDRGPQVRAALAGRDVIFVLAPDYASGLSASLRCGLAAVPDDWQAAIVMLGDMPLVTPATLQALAAIATLKAVGIPTWQGRRGNPVLWGRFHFPALAQLSGDSGGRGLLSFLPVTLVAADSDGILQDIDTPTALAALRAKGE